MIPFLLYIRQYWWCNVSKPIFRSLDPGPYNQVRSARNCIEIAPRVAHNCGMKYFISLQTIANRSQLVLGWNHSGELRVQAGFAFYLIVSLLSYLKQQAINFLVRLAMPTVPVWFSFNRQRAKFDHVRGHPLPHMRPIWATPAAHSMELTPGEGVTSLLGSGGLF